MKTTVPYGFAAVLRKDMKRVWYNYTRRLKRASTKPWTDLVVETKPPAKETTP